MPTLRQFRYFEMLARIGHFGRAAGECAVSQPALSMQIQELERELGVVLLERRRDGVVLTPEGREVLARSALVLAQVEEISGLAQARAGLPATVRLGIIPTLGPYLLPDILPAYSAEYPLSKLLIRETRTAALLDELRHGRLDLVLCALPVDIAGLESEALFEDRFLLASAANRPPPPQSALPEYIASEQLLLLEEGHCLRDQALRHCEAAGVRFGEIYGTSNISTLVQMVANGLGVTLVPEISIATEVRPRQVLLSRFAEPQPCRTLALVWRARSPLALHFPALAALIRSIGLKRLANLPQILPNGSPLIAL